ncbi:hypothetical protein [Promicromonospora sp. NPDC090134]|uniref:hypothetical protein n=1 Tax=Promicromonospora sp. NPDC090134 TaxID=3364408 RepID=UPI00382F92FB
MNRTYSRQVIAAWLHGYTTGHANGWHDGRRAGHAEGYDAGHADGIPEGRIRADRDASAKYAAALEWSRRNSFPPVSRRPWGEAKPMPTPADCLATWPAPAALHAVRHAA